VLCGLALAWVLAELCLLPFEAVRPNPRHAPGVHEDRVGPGGFLVPDGAVGWRMRPDFEFRHETPEFTVTYRSDAVGHRRGTTPPDGEGHQRIVVVGDSFTFGIGAEYEDTFPARLERALDGVSIHNLALPGFGVDQMWLELTETGMNLAPDLVLVAVCDADFSRSLSGYYHGNQLNKPAFRRAGGELLPRTREDRLPQPLRWLDERSRVWMAWRQVLRRLDYSRPISEWWYLNEAILDELRATCEARGVPVVFVYVPTPEWRSFPTLARYMERTGATYVDLTEGAPGQRDHLHFPRDRHFTPAGHEYAARRIEAVLRSHL